jgi:diguanylate cyclase (GGDEF)-like protein
MRHRPPVRGTPLASPDGWLPDIYNRFSLHKRLDTLIQEADQSCGNFGLIYIDPDRFKPINDTYGHHVGDVYLQAVAVRMKDQNAH